MMTKAQETEILNKIEKLIAQAGEESYIGWAFAGCVNRARENIEYDFALNPQEELECARKQTEEVRKEMSREINKANGEALLLRKEKAQLTFQLENKDNEVRILREEKERLAEELAACKAKLDKIATMAKWIGEAC